MDDMSSELQAHYNECGHGYGWEKGIKPCLFLVLVSHDQSSMSCCSPINWLVDTQQLPKL